MNKSLLALACLALPLAALAVSPKAGTPHADQAAASAPAPAASAIDARASVRSAQQHGSKNAACRKEVGDQGLTGQAYKAALVACMKQGQ